MLQDFGKIKTNKQTKKNQNKTKQKTLQNGKFGSVAPVILRGLNAIGLSDRC